MGKKTVNGKNAAASRLKLDQVMREGETWKEMWCRLAFEESPQAMAVIDRKLRLIKVNKSFCRQSGYSEKELTGSPLGNLVNRDDLRATSGNREGMVRGRIRRAYVEKRFTAKNGKVGWVGVTVNTIRDARGKFLCFLAVVENITERKRAEAALRESEEQLRLTFEESPLSMALVDRQLRFIKANRTFFRSTGIAADRLKEHSLRELVSAEELSRTRGERERLVRGEIRQFRAESKSTSKNGEDKWVAVTVAAVRDADDKFLYYLITAENITERKLAEAALRESEERFRLAFENNLVGMGMVDRNFRYLKVNEAYCRILGYTEKELLQRSLLDVTHPDDTPPHWKDLRRTLSGGRDRYRVEKRFIRKTGEIVWAAVTVTVVRDARGKFLHTVGLVENITERKLAEAALRESEERFRLAFEKGPVGMVLTGMDKKLLRVNDAFCRIMGYSREELLGRSFTELTHPDHVRGNVRATQALFRGEVPQYRTEKRYIRKDGGIVWASVTVSVLRDLRGKFNSFLTFIEDITDRKRAEEALRESEERFRLSFEENMVGMAMIARDHSYIRANAAYCRMMGYTEKELKRMKLSDVTHPDDYSWERIKLKKMAQGEMPRFRAEKRYITKNGETVWGSLMVSAIRDKQGKFLCTMGIVEDITERKRAEAALHESERRYRSIFENAPFGIFHSTVEGKLIDVNETYARQLGYSSVRECIDTINKKGVSEALYVRPERRQRFVRKTLAAGGWHQFENLYKRKDGGVMPGLLRFRAMPKDPFTGADLEGFVEDISAKKSAEEKVRLYQEKLRDLSLQLAFVEEKERQRLANNIHDYIGQSLSCAMLALGSLEDGMSDDPKAREALRKVRAHIEEGIQYARSVTFELSPAILFKLGFEAVVEWLADRLLAPDGIRFSITGDSPLLLPDSEVRVILYRAVRELLINVARHSKAREVRIDLRKIRGSVEITVQDDGKGFDILLLQKRTEGFGLFSVREQLMYVGGRMSIISKPGKGSTVSIILPLNGKARPDEEPVEGQEGEVNA